MRAAQVTRLDGPDFVEVRDDVAEPEPRNADEVLVEVAAAGINFPDVLQTRGEYQVRPELPFTPGSEFAGTVVRTPQAGGFAVGDKVMGINWGGVGGGSGTFAERAVGVVSRMMKLPVDMSFTDAAAIPMNVFTADFALRHRGELRPGETVLVHGAGGGLGQALIQVAVAMGATVIGVASSEEKVRVATAAGAQEVISPDGFRDRVAELTNGRGVDLVADPVGGDRFTDSLRSLARGGRVLVLGFTGREIPTVRVNRLLLRNIGVLGVGWGEAVHANPELIRKQWEVLAPWAEQGRLAPPHLEQFALQDLTSALRRIDDRQACGKVVLTI